MVNGIASSPMPKTAPPKENNMNNIGISNTSVPLVLLIIFIIPASTAPVLSTIPKAPPTTNIKAIIPTEVPHLSPFTNPSKAKLRNPISPPLANSLIPFFSPDDIYFPYSCKTLKFNWSASFFDSKAFARFFLIEPRGSSISFFRIKVESPEESKIYSSPFTLNSTVSPSKIVAIFLLFAS